MTSTATVKHTEPNVLEDILARDVARGIELVAKAEADLGPLSDGQVRDLLMDNTEWPSSWVERVSNIVLMNKAAA